MNAITIREEKGHYLKASGGGMWEVWKGRKGRESIVIKL